MSKLLKMTQDQIDERIEYRRYEKIEKYLKEHTNGTKELSKKNVVLGLLFFTKPKGNNYYYSNIKYATPNNTVYKQFSNYDLETLWDGEHYALLVHIFGEERASFIRKAYKNIHKYMYQEGYSRRSFRRPHNKIQKELSQINFIIKLIYEETSYDFSLEEGVKFSNMISYYGSPIDKLWAEAINEGNEIYDLMKEIILGDAEKGTVSSVIIKSLLCSERKEAWELVGNLLLSAQRQEGLRQTILEALDETSIGAFEYFLDLIIEHKLIRFSSVVRALDTWVGLGWEAEKQNTTKRFMELAQKYFKNPELLDKEINNKDNAEVFMALWGQGVHDIDKCYPYLKKLYEKGSIEKKTLVLYFVNQAEIQEWSNEFGVLALYEENPQLQYWGKMIAHNSTHFDRIFELYKGFKEKEITFTGKVFSWLSFTYSKEIVGDLLIDIAESDEDKMNQILAIYDELPVVNREKIVRKILDGYTGWSFDPTEKFPKPTEKQRDLALKIIKDRSEYIRNTAMRTLSSAELSSDEILHFEGLLTRKSSNFRRFVLQMIQKRSVDESFASAERLVNAKNIEQRLAGLDLLTDLYRNKDLKNRVKEIAEHYAERKRIGKKEQILLDVLLSEEQEIYDASNGYGLYDVNNVSPKPVIKKPTSGVYVETQKNYGFSKSISEIENDIADLVKLIEKYKDYEYEQEYYNSREKVILGNSFDSMKYYNNDEEKKLSPREIFENYPLPEVWEEWYKKSKLTPLDLSLITFYDNLEDRDNPDLFKKTQQALKGLFAKIKFPRFNKKSYYHTEIKIIKNLSDLYPYEEKNAFYLGFLETCLSLIPAEELNITCDYKRYYTNDKYTVFQLAEISQLRYRINNSDEKLFPKIWNELQFIYQNTPSDAEYDNTLDIELYCDAYKANLCTKDELFARFMDADVIKMLTSNVESKNWNARQAKRILKDYPFLTEFIEPAKKRILEIELKRGDRETSVSKLATNLGYVEGVDNLVGILNALGKDTISRGYSYYAGISKKEVLSNLLTASHPAKNETQEDFNKKIKASKFPDKRLIELALYAQQWLPFVADYLNWKGLESGVWWLQAHTNEYSYAEKETYVSRYSEIPMSRFADGAVDYNWFLDAYKDLGKKHWQMLYESAKYISDGTGHTRAKLYADVILGNVKIREITKRVKDKRNKDYVRVYGLAPLSKKIPKKDLLNRYNYLLEFKKESKQFGAQRQASEGLAVEIAMENLARTAGYSDPIRLTWAMETEEAKTIINNADPLHFDDYTIELKVDELGKSHIISRRGDKTLKSLPAKLKKEKSVIELKDFHKRLKNQYSRSRKSLEEAMVRGDEFTMEEIHNLAEHPVISPMLSALALISDGNIGFYKNGKLINENGDSFELAEHIRIAHCTDFYAKGNWSALQSFCFDHEIVQPFKQIFRELYVPTADELQEKYISRRYAGHQVQPKKTVALLKTKLWTVDYEEGLQRVFHKEGLIAKIYAMADWFSPADTESPTLETVQFFSRNDHKKVAFEDINPIIFSEIMRDVDLVVSVAHVGGVDPEASHSTVEMRAVIIRETARLFKLANVTIEGHHAHIKGHFGDYTVHLGSAVTHMNPGKYLSILPVHSQHRGRLFLPFVDDDPRSAELMSKILLLAKDKEIKDPTVLRQIQG